MTKKDLRLVEKKRKLSVYEVQEDDNTFYEVRDKDGDVMLSCDSEEAALRELEQFLAYEEQNRPTSSGM